jgi:hypothetical protein
VPSNDKRRDTTRRQLERQLAQRQQQAARRRRVTMIASVASTVVVVVVIVVLVIVLGGNNGSKSPAAGSSAAGSGSASTDLGPSVTFDGVTVAAATVLAVQPTVTTAYTGEPKALEYKDLVVGTGKAATDTSAVKAQYVGALYKTGAVFDSSWKDGAGGPVAFTLGPGNVIDGFTEGIGGTAAIPPMKIGGRRLVIMPASLGYGASPPSGSTIPANASLIFVIDLTSVDS